jgi:hypothetical protein
MPVVWAIGGMLVLLATLLTAQETGNTTSESVQIGVPQMESTSVDSVGTAVMSDLPQMTSPGAIRAIPFGSVLGEAQLRALKEQHIPSSGGDFPPADAPRLLEESGILANTPTVSQTVLPPNAAKETVCGYIPSDMAIAANSSNLVQVANDCVFVINPSTGLVKSGFPKSINSILSFPASHAVGDPRAMYDSAAGRFIIMAEDFSANPTLLGVAASATSDPTGAYYAYHITMGALNDFGDFPMLGQTESEDGDRKGAIYLSWNLFLANGGFSNRVHTLGKTAVYNGTSAPGSLLSNFTVSGVVVDSIQPVNVADGSDRPSVEYLINSFNNANPVSARCSGGKCNGYALWAIAHGVPASGSPTVSGLVVSTSTSYSIPANAHQKGVSSGSCLVDTGDNRLSAMVYYKGGQLWAAHNVGISVGSAIHLVEVHPTLKPPSGSGVSTLTSATNTNEVCFGCGGFSNNGSGYYGAIIPDQEGNWTMSYAFSSDTTFPSISYLSNRVSHPIGSLADSGFSLKAGQAKYCQLDNTGRNRWGDYTAGAPLIGVGPGVAPFWFSGQWSDSSGNWETAIGRQGYTNVNQIGD